MIDKGYVIDQSIGDEDMDEVKLIQKGVRLQIKLNQLKGVPIARYDAKARKPYLEYPDGRREYDYVI